MAKKLDIQAFNNGLKCVSIGKLTNEVIYFLRNKYCGNNKIINNLNECEILFWNDRIGHTEKHKENFNTPEEYYECLKSIPNIIKNPDYIGLHPNDNSIQYIKIISEIVLVAVRISHNRNASYRTMYPITDSQLNDYIRKNRAWKFNRIIDIIE